MGSIRTCLQGLLAASSLFAGVAAAQTYDHSVYLDVDNNTATGCSAVTAAGTVNGAEARITATVTGDPPMVTGVTRAMCAGGVFGAAQPQSGTYAAGLNNGTNGADVIELGTSLAGLGQGGPARFTFVSSSAAGADLVSGVVQLPGSGLVNPTAPILVPATGIIGLLLMVGLVVLVVRRHPGFATSAAVILMLGAGAVWAANFVVDGQIGDWVGVAPIATDASNDSTSGDPRVEIVAVFAAAEAGSLFLRFDVLDAQIPTNNAPVLDDTAFNVAENSVAGTAVGTIAATDANAGQTLTYSITAGNASGAFAINAATGAITVANSAPLDFETTPAFTLTMSVSDNGVPVMSDTATLTISQTDVNEAPVLDDGARAVAEDSAAGTQVGAPLGGTDPDAGTTFTYAITAGNTNGAFAVDNAGQLTVANATAITTTGTFTLTVSITDNGGLTDTAAITVTVTDQNDAPTFTGEPYAFSLQENRPAATVVGSVGATDADAGQTIAFAITGGNTGGAFAIDAAGQITVANAAAMDFETNPNFTLTITATDNGGVPLSDSASVAIMLTDLNEAPTVTDGVAAVAENAPIGTSVTTVVATDPDTPASVNATLTFAITAGNTGNAFTIDPTTGVISTAAAPVLANSPYSLTVTVTDGGALSDTATITITVTDQNDAPTLADAAFNVAENSAGGTAVGTVTATDPDAGQTIAYAIVAGNDAGGFAIDLATGAIVVADANVLDFETTPVFALTVQATDNGAPPLSDTAQVTITLTNANDAPRANDAAMTIAENSANGIAVGIYTATDPDAGQTLSYAITGGTGAGFFAINAGTGQVTVSDSAGLNVEATPTLTLGITATDDGPGNLSDSGTITITLSNVNEAPVANDATFSVPENSVDGTLVGNVVANDPDAGAVLAYSITAGNTNGAFAIDPASGTITVANQAEIDVGASFSLTVSVTDGTLADTATITVTVDDVNEPPVPTAAPSDTPTVNENSAIGTPVATISANDPEAAQTHTFAIQSGDAASFAIDATTGVITVNGALDFETAPANPSVLVIRVTDNGTPSLFADLTVTITIADVDEAPTITSAASANVPENTTAVLTVTSTDPENSPIIYGIAGGVDGGFFTIDPTTGALAFIVAPDFDLPADAGADNVYNLIVSASDGSNTPTQAIAVTVTNLNDAPVFTSADTANVPENTMAVITVVAIDPDVADTVGYSITGGADAALFSIDAGNGALTFNAAPDFESPIDAGADNLYNVVVTASDGTQSPTQAIAVTVTDANEAPAFTSAATFNVAENTTAVGTVTTTDPEGNTVTYSISGGADGALFSIDTNTGAITFLFAPDFEAPADAGANNVYDLQITATDGSTPVNQAVAVTVTNVDEPPAFTSSPTPSVPENQTAVTTVVASDPEGGAVTYSIVGGADAGDFIIDANTGVLSFALAPDFEAPSDADANNVHLVDVQAVAGATPITQNLTVTVTNANEAPMLADQTRNIDENSANGMAVGAVLLFSDPDIGQLHTFAITAGNTGGAFAIDNVGQITVANVAQLDFETTPQFVLTVSIADNGAPNLSDTATITIDVDNVNEAPIAAADAYNYTGNTELRIAGHAGTTGAIAFTAAATNPLANDTDPDSPASGFATLSAVVVDGGTSANNGSFDITADGTVRYTPPAGFTGADSLTYQLTDGTHTVNGTLNVTMTGTDVVWYVRNNDATADGTATRDGTSSFPYNTLAGASVASLANHIIYVHVGDGSTAGQNSGIVLKNGQDLLGNGVALVVNATPLIAAGTQPQIGNSAGIGVSASNLAGVVVRGLDIAGSTDAVFANSTLGGGDIEIADNTIRAAGNEGIDIEAGGSGAFNASIHDNMVTATGTGIDISETAGTLTITAFDDNTVSGNTGGAGIVVTNATFDTVPGAPFTTVSGGTTAVGASGNGVGTSGIVLTTVTGDLSFTRLDLFASAGNGLAATGNGTFNAAAGTGLRLVATSGSDVFEAAGGPAVNIGTATINLVPNRVTSSGSATFGLNLDTVAGTFTAGASSSIGTPTSAAGTAFRVNAGSVSTSYAGTVVATQGSGVAITNNTGTHAFVGLLTLGTGANPAFTATGGGSVSSTNNASTLATTTGIALNVVNTTIGAGGLMFRSISSNGSSSGIVLDTTCGVSGCSSASVGGLTVSGDGTAASNASGGLIQNTTGVGIRLNSTRNASLRQINLTATGSHGMDASRVTNFTYRLATITNGGNGNDEHSMNLLNLFGTSLVEDVAFNTINEDGVQVRQNAVDDAVQDTLTLRRINVGAHKAGFGEAGVEAQADVASNFLLTLDDSDFAINANATLGINVGTASTFTGTLGFTATNNVFNAANAFGSGSIQVLGGGHGTQNVTITGNQIIDTKFDGIRVNNDFGPGTAGSASVTRATISGNTIDGSGASNNGEGITLRQDGATATTPPAGDSTLIALISNNTISGFMSNQVHVQASDGNTNASSVQATITNNTGTIQAGGFGAGLLIDVGDGSNLAKNSACSNISGNNLRGSNSTAFFDFDITLQLNEAGGAGDAKLAVVQAGTAALSAANSGVQVSAYEFNPPGPANPIDFGSAPCTQP